MTGKGENGAGTKWLGESSQVILKSIIFNNFNILAVQNCPVI
jgi:hypothetical protein